MCIIILLQHLIVHIIIRWYRMWSLCEWQRGGTRDVVERTVGSYISYIYTQEIEHRACVRARECAFVCIYAIWRCSRVGGWYRYWNNIYRPGTKVGFGECLVLYVYIFAFVCVQCTPTWACAVTQNVSGSESRPYCWHRICRSCCPAGELGGGREHLTLDFLYIAYAIYERTYSYSIYYYYYYYTV